MSRIRNATEQSSALRDRRMADEHSRPRFVCPYCHNGGFTLRVVESICDLVCSECLEKVKPLLLAGGRANVVGFAVYCQRCERTVATLLGALDDLGAGRP